MKERDTSIGRLTCEHGLWLGRYRDAPTGADVELLVNGDSSAPSEKEIDTMRSFLSDFGKSSLAFRSRLFMAWSFYPIRIAVNVSGSLGVQFQSILPFLGRKMVQDDGTVF